MEKQEDVVSCSIKRQFLKLRLLFMIIQFFFGIFVVLLFFPATCFDSSQHLVRQGHKLLLDNSLVT